MGTLSTEWMSSLILVTFGPQMVIAQLTSNATLTVMSVLHNVWHDQHLSLPTKTCIYQALALSILPYAAETWTIVAGHENSESILLSVSA